MYVWNIYLTLIKAPFCNEWIFFLQKLQEFNYDYNEAILVIINYRICMESFLNCDVMFAVWHDPWLDDIRLLASWSGSRTSWLCNDLMLHDQQSDHSFEVWSSCGLGHFTFLTSGLVIIYLLLIVLIRVTHYNVIYI